MNTQTGAYHAQQSHFGCSEEFLANHAAQVPLPQLQKELQKRAISYDPFWFHQSISLGIFNQLGASAKSAFRALHQTGLLQDPQTLQDWEKHAKFWVLQFAAYFEAFYPAGQQYVGGGVDAVSIPWP